MTSSPADIRLLALTADIMAAYVSNNHVQPGDLPDALASVHGVLLGLHRKQNPVEAPPRLSPQEIARSITTDFLISFEDGKPYKTLRRHLAIHGLTPDEYRAKWGLDAKYPMTAPSYSERRSELARALGLGRRHRVPEAAAVTQASKRSRGAVKPRMETA